MHIKIIEDILLISVSVGDIQDLVESVLPPQYHLWWNHKYSDDQEFIRFLESDPEMTMMDGITTMLDRYVEIQKDLTGRFTNNAPV